MKNIIKEIKSLFVLILAVLFLKETVVELYIVPTGSMEKNILRGDMLIGSRYIYGMKVPQKIWIPFTAISIPTFLPEYRFPAFKEIERGDVVVFEYPRDNVYKYVKRCIGLPGDSLKIEDRKVFVNNEEYLDSKIDVMIHNKIKTNMIINNGKANESSMGNSSNVNILGNNTNS